MHQKGLNLFTSIPFPESPFPLTSGRIMRALGAAISGMRHRCRLRSELDGQNSVISLLILRMVAPRALVYYTGRWSRETKTLGTRLYSLLNVLQETVSFKFFGTDARFV